MLDEMRVLRAAIQNYRAAVTAAGVPWPEAGATQDAQPPDLDLIHRVFDVDHLPEQLSWFRFEGWDPRWPCPVDGELEPWPTDARTTRESLSVLCFAIATPFPWRRQIPLFRFDPYVFTFVLDGDHEGEIWRYLISPDLYDPVRAAPAWPPSSMRGPAASPPAWSTAGRATTGSWSASPPKPPARSTCSGSKRPISTS
ncbi:hypothetical protein ACFQS1_33755 [Paractinoplanes rhizophilus]|uniref:Uncharacterized protein n=1 Tax=Paractinoplanes rhizophilus TaxID=1416877 RepID=A0ABW2I252_9ACTN